MLISSESVNTLAEKISSSNEVFCTGLFLSARWFVMSQLDHDGIQLVVLPDKESAEYCAADLYNLIEGDNVFQVCFTDPNQGAASAQYISEHELATKVAIIYDSSDIYSSGIYR